MARQTESAAEKLKSVGISAVNGSSPYAELFDANHESMAPLTSPAPQNTGVHYLSELTHPGDSHHFNTSKKILALPITAPWGTMARACELGQQLEPQYIIPIHDWHYRDEARAIFYPRLKEFFANLG